MITYEEIVTKVRKIYEDMDARAVWEHVAVQINITGQGGGVFYIEIAHRSISVEPYDYYDKDGLITVDGDTIMAIANGQISLKEAYESGRVKIEGNYEKLELLRLVKRKKTSDEKQSDVKKQEQTG